MDCGIPFCHGPTGCPVHNQIPDWNDLVFQSDWEEASRNLHSTNNFPEFTGRICPAPCEEACTLNLENQPVAIKTIEQAIADRAWNMGWVKPEPAADPHRQARRRRRLRAGRHGGGPAARPRRARRPRLRARAEGRWPAPLRHPRLQDGEAPHRPARAADGGRGRRLPLQPEYRRDEAGRRAEGRVRRRDVLRRRRGSAQPAACRARTSTGVHYAMPYLVQSNRRVGNEPMRGNGELPILASRQERRGDRRRRHGLRLRRHGLPAGRPVGDAARHPPAAAGARGQADGMAVLADQDADLLEPGRGGRARVPGGDAPARRQQEGSRHRRRLRPGRRQAPADRGQRVRPPAPTSSSWRSASPARSRRAFSSSPASASSKRGNVEANEEDYRTSDREDLGGGRHAPRPVPGRLGDPRGPPGGARHRRDADGRQPSCRARRPARPAPAGAQPGGQRKSSARPGCGIGAFPRSSVRSTVPRLSASRGRPFSRCAAGRDLRPAQAARPGPPRASPEAPGRPAVPAGSAASR